MQRRSFRKMNRMSATLKRPPIAPNKPATQGQRSSQGSANRRHGRSAVIANSYIEKALADSLTVPHQPIAIHQQEPTPANSKGLSVNRGGGGSPFEYHIGVAAVDGNGYTDNEPDKRINNHSEKAITTGRKRRYRRGCFQGGSRGVRRSCRHVFPPQNPASMRRHDDGRTQALLPRDECKRTPRNGGEQTRARVDGIAAHLIVYVIQNIQITAARRHRDRSRVGTCSEGAAGECSQRSGTLIAREGRHIRPARRVHIASRAIHDDRDRTLRVW